VRDRAVNALGHLLGQASRADMLAMLDDPSPAVVRSAARVPTSTRLELADLLARHP
jgi:hypothetical protein